MKRIVIATLLVCLSLATVSSTGTAQSQTDAVPAPPESPPAQAVPASPPTTTQSPSEGPPEDYLIQKEDVLRISILGEPEMASEQVVDPKGSINMSLLGSVYAEGLTRKQLTDKLAAGLSKYFVEPKIQVTLAQFRRPKVYVVGRVNRPGLYEFRQGDRVMEAIAQAGSFPETAYLEGATLTHRDSKESIPLNLRKLFYEGDMSQNAVLQDGDTIYMPEDVTNRYFVLGEVYRPGKYELKEKLSVIDAISMAGGVTERGNARTTYIIRGDPKSPQRIKVDVTKFLKSADLTQNVALLPGDVIYVPGSSKPDWGKISGMLSVIVNTGYLARMWGL